MRLSLLLLLLLPIPAFAYEVNFTPLGSVKQPAQARAVFSENMVPMGSVGAPGPFRIDCEIPGDGHWEDAKTWIYDFKETPPGGKACAFTLVPGTKAVGGSALKGNGIFRFDTGGPQIRQVRPWEGSQIDEEQVFLLQLDAKPAPGSLEKSLYFEIEGLQERVPPKFFGESDLKKAMAASGLRPSPVFFYYLVGAGRTFPNDRRVALLVAPGLKAANGLATPEESRRSFTVRPKFAISFSCLRENAQAACSPIASSMSLRFSSPVATSEARKIRLKSGNQEWKPAITDTKEIETSYFEFEGIYPPAAQMQVVLPPGLKDAEGRKLENSGSFPLGVKTAEYPPLIKFAGNFGLIEAADPVLPVTVRNVEAELKSSFFPGKAKRFGPGQAAEVIRWLKKTPHYDGKNFVKSPKYGEERGLSLFSPLDEAEGVKLPKPNGAKAFEVIGIPLKNKGFHVVEIESPVLGASLLGKNAPMFVHAKALVTDLSAHLKLGKEGALVWLTRLSNGKPVAGAKIELRDHLGAILAQGQSDKDGLFRTNHSIKPDHWQEVYAFASLEGDFTFVSSAWDDGLEGWRFSLSTYDEKGGLAAHSVLDRSLFRAGETVHFKHFVRQRNLAGIARGKFKPKNLVIQSSTGQVFYVPVKLDAKGQASSEWRIPKDAKLGTYRAYLSSVAPKPKAAAKKGSSLIEEKVEDTFSAWGRGVIQSAEFRVEEFRIPILKGRMEWAKGGKDIQALVGVEYTAGGPAKGLAVLARGAWKKISEKTFPRWDGFLFANGGLTEGRTSRDYEEYGVCSEESECGPDYYENEPGSSQASLELPNQNLVLDDKGGTKIDVKKVPSWDSGAALRLEAEFKDPNGEIFTTSRSRDYFPRDRVIGIKTDGWFSSKDDVRFTIAVADDNGQPVRGEEVRATWYESASFSHRKKILGGFYAYEHFEEVKKLGGACEGVTDEKGMLQCRGTAPATGNLALAAEMKKGGVRAHQDLWITGKDSWFTQGDSDRIDVLPEKKEYEPGETARFQVRMPFREATALISIEREGVKDTYVRRITNDQAFVEVPVKPDYAPNMFVSVLVVRGRVGDVKPTALVDLGKPAFKYGIAEISVGWKAHELKVAVSTVRPEYRVREKVKAKVKVVSAMNGRAPAAGEVALAVVDEALLELKSNESWQLLEAMMARRPYLVRTSTAQSQVIGKRHYGLKANPVGGGGGHMTSRELFDTLVYWNPSVKLNAKGEAEVEFALNDSLSSFRIVAVASAGADKFGTGSAAVKSFQELMIFSGVTPLAREGDVTHPEITIRNTTAKELKVSILAKAGNAALAPHEVALGAGEAKKISWKFEIPRDLSSLDYEFSLASGKIRDLIRVKQEVQPPLRDSVIQATLEQLSGKMEVPVALPANAVKDGTFAVKLDRSLLAGLEPVRSYMKEYPFTCLEQKISQAVVLRDQKQWNEISADMAAFQDVNGLLKYFPQTMRGSIVLTIYVLALSHEAGYKLNPAVEKAALRAMENFLAGRLGAYEGYWAASHLQWLRVGVIEVLTRYNRFDAGWLTTLPKDISTWPNSALTNWWLIHQRRGEIPGREETLKRVSNMLKSRLHWRGTVAAFNDATEQGYWMFMESEDANANRLLLAANTQADWQADMGRFARGIFARRKRGAWDLTTANAWGVLAAEKFAAVHEKESVSGKSTVRLDQSTQTVEWQSVPGSKIMSFPWTKESRKLTLSHEGAGKPWALLYAKAPLKLDEPIFKGYRFTRTITPVTQAEAGKWKVGDVYRVRLELDAPADMSWVVVQDPIPAGATVLGSGLGGDSSLLTEGERNESRSWWSSVDERRFEGFRRYYEFLPAGKAVIEYTVRLNAAGHFQLPNSRVEAMYSPEMYGEAPNAAMDILP